MTDPSLFSDAPKKYAQPYLLHVLQEIFEKYPEAARFDPCPCGVVAVIIPRRYVQPFHYLIDDPVFRDRVRAILSARDTLFSNYDGEDAVLVLAELA